MASDQRVSLTQGYSEKYELEQYLQDEKALIKIYYRNLSLGSNQADVQR